MNPDLEHLIVLQAQDLDLARLRSDLAKLPGALQVASAALRGAEASLKDMQSALAAEEKLRRTQESDIATHQAKVTRLRRSLESATSAAQVSAFEHEIAFAETAIGGLEEQELASMERTEELESRLKAAEAAVARGATALEAEQVRGKTDAAAWTAQVSGVEQQRAELRAQVDPAVLARYDRLLKAKGTALAEALGNATQGKCAACQMSVRPQRWQDLTGRDHLDEIFTCESCGRMLFWDPRRDTPRAWEAGDRLRRAQTGSAR